MSEPVNDDIVAVVRAYVEAMAAADEPRLRAAFHPAAAIIGNYEGEVEWLSLDQFIAAILDAGASPVGRSPYWDIESVDRTPDSAVVRVVDDFAGMRFTDHLSLLKIGPEWRIVNKLYHLRAANEPELVELDALNASNDG
ncbi:nuclear transport factor 2 family protein [Starkeya sp. ORNL1]|uniref:nuclear transport factor 2 family protein n=1 Tax=Starkeya sp. ORNL1 TaxID=2709380 RepID=UPI0014647E5C|nr:nuclear transport factor 2 family protein [Starkeya sp. ORNL1]QJP14410.1 nuclear transport factor 2 family protein [Starkeya sp. ORNL1]